MYASITHILNLTSIKRARLLDRPGVVKVRVGQQVSAADIIAEETCRGSHAIVDVRRALSITRGAIGPYIANRKPGELIQKGDILAQTNGLFRKVARSPIDGKILAIGSSQILLEANGESRPLLSGYAATVTDLVPERGAILEASGALVQGAWGNGGINQGMMICALQTADEELTSARLDVSLRGAVVLAGHVLSPEVLKAAAELSLRGLIIPGLASDLIPLALGMPFPLVVVEGFGRLGYNPHSLEILIGSEKRDTSLYAAVPDYQQNTRPEIFIPLPAGADYASDGLEFKPGQSVLIHGAPYNRRIGKLKRLRADPVRLSNGLRVQAADVILESSENQIITVPLSNLDIIE